MTPDRNLSADPDQIGGPDACLVAATCPDCSEPIPTGRPFEVMAAEDHDGSPCPDCQFLNGAPV
jgi:hypothetical protein